MPTARTTSVLAFVFPLHERSTMDVRVRMPWVGAILAILILAMPVHAQTGSITGRLTAADTGRPLVAAYVVAIGADGRAVGSVSSNQDGNYRIGGLAPGSYTVTVSAIGYGTQTIGTAQVTAGGSVSIDASLEPRAIELNPVIISVGKEPEKALEAPARVDVIGSAEIEARPSVTPVDHLRNEASIDIITAGVQSSFVVARGFNNIFSGALHALTDNRIAGIPSLRVNLLHFIPQTSEDFERMEVVLGPGSALYGPNTANGVLHIITKSPIDAPGTKLSISGGEQSLLQFTGRTAYALSDRFGFKLSGQYFRADEWQFTDSVELAARTQAATSFATWAALQPRGPDGQPLSTAELQRRASLLGARDFETSRWALDARADWRPSENVSTVFSAGWTSVTNGIELTGIGAGQVKDWLYGYYQARLNYKRLFAQTYLNTSDAGETFLLRTGGPIVDKSKLIVSQLQHGFSAGSRLDFTYGGDFIRTIPVTEGTIDGSREESDNYNQYGIYAQGRASLSPKFDLVAAAREDWHSELNDPVFSPRAALVFKPTPTQNFRFTYNRAFSTPTSLNLFLDIDGGPAGPLGPLGFRVRAQGPGKDGIRLTTNGVPTQMRSPFLGQPSQLLTIDAATLYELQARALFASAAAQGAPIPAALQGFILGLKGNAAVAALGVQALNASTGQRAPLAQAGVADVPGIEPSTTQTFEVGYKGILGGRFLIAADVWRSQEKNFTSPLVVRTPALLLDPLALGGFLVPQITQALMAQGVPAAQAQAQATAIAQGMASIPGGVVSSPDVAAQGTDLLATYVNFGKLDLWGADLSLKALLTDEWSLGVTAAFTNKDNFCLSEEVNGVCPTTDLVALNAPQDKGTAAVTYDGSTNGFRAEGRVRYTSEFPVNSADFIGIGCIVPSSLQSTVKPCVKSYTIFDLTLGYDLPNIRGTSLQLGITNLFNEDYRSFIGVPAVGRMALLRLQVEF